MLFMEDHIHPINSTCKLCHSKPEDPFNFIAKCPALSPVWSRLPSTTPEMIKPHLPDLEVDPLRFTKVAHPIDFLTQLKSVHSSLILQSDYAPTTGCCNLPKQVEGIKKKKALHCLCTDKLRMLYKYWSVSLVPSLRLEKLSRKGLGTSLCWVAVDLSRSRMITLSWCVLVFFASQE